MGCACAKEHSLCPALRLSNSPYLGGHGWMILRRVISLTLTLGFCYLYRSFSAEVVTFQDHKALVHETAVGLSLVLLRASTRISGFHFIVPRRRTYQAARPRGIVLNDMCTQGRWCALLAR